jgi:uncharacterized protein YndB with AHSA1/START domain
MTTTLSNPTVKPFVISRTFDAPRERVWQAWTERERLMQWFGPKGCTMPSAKMDFRPGGMFHFSLRSPDDREMWGRWIFREITAPERIVLVQSFSDEHGGIGRHPMSPTWPREMLSTTRIEATGGRTRLTIEWLPLNATAEECGTFDAGRDGMTQGWNGTFDQLAEYLAKS